MDHGVVLGYFCCFIMSRFDFMFVFEYIQFIGAFTGGILKMKTEVGFVSCWLQFKYLAAVMNKVQDMSTFRSRAHVADEWKKVIAQIFG